MSEFGPSPTPEEATGIEEKETQGIAIAHEIAELRISARSEADYEAVLKKTRELRRFFAVGSESRLSGEVIEQMRRAREIIGKENFVGPPEIQIAFGFEPELSTVPEIPFTEDDLEKAKELEQMLVLRVDKAPDGSPLTMQKIKEITGNKVKDGGEVFYDQDWYEDEEFYKGETVNAGWALVSKEFIPESTSKNYLEQTEVAIDYLRNQVFAGKPLPKEYQDAIDEFESQKTEIAGLLGSDWQSASEKLAKLSITGLIRQSPVEAIYDLTTHFQNTEERLLPEAYAWTSRRDSGGSLVDVGDVGSDGVGVYDDGPGDRRGLLGVSFSRSL